VTNALRGTARKMILRGEDNMPGTKTGGQRAAEKNKFRHGNDFYKRIGAIGGSRTGVRKGFAANPALASIAGTIGGTKSRRGKARQGVEL
jgi:uncharacterized protein